MTDPVEVERIRKQASTRKRSLKGKGKESAKGRSVKLEVFPFQEVCRGGQEERKSLTSRFLLAGQCWIAARRRVLLVQSPAAVLAQVCEKRGRKEGYYRNVQAVIEKYHKRGQVIASFIKL